MFEIIEWVNRKLLGFQCDNTDVMASFEKHKKTLLRRFRKIMRLCVPISGVYCVAGIIAAVALGFSGLGSVEVLFLATLCAFSGCLSLLSMNRSGTVLASLVAVSLILEIVWFLIFFVDDKLGGTGAVITMALFGLINLACSVAIAFLGSSYTFLSEYNGDVEKYMISDKLLVKNNNEQINTSKAELTPPNLKAYVEEPPKTETEIMAANLESAFLKAKLS